MSRLPVIILEENTSEKIFVSEWPVGVDLIVLFYGTKTKRHGQIRKDFQGYYSFFDKKRKISTQVHARYDPTYVWLESTGQEIQFYRYA